MNLKEVDMYFSQYIRARDPICKKCKKKPSTDCSHQINRHNHSVRWFEYNAVGLCRECHQYLETRKYEHSALIPISESYMHQMMLQPGPVKFFYGKNLECSKYEKDVIGEYYKEKLRYIGKEPIVDIEIF